MHIKKFAIVFLIAIISIAGASANAQPDETDILMLIAPVLASAGSCDEGQYATCASSIGCTHIGGLWENGSCKTKTENWRLTRMLAGKWNLSTVFPEGNNTTFFQFDPFKIELIGKLGNYSIEGGSHQSAQFNTPKPILIVGAYDSTELDWFMLEKWGEDIGLASLYEFEFTSLNRISGCEFFVSYPDLRYTTGICNPFTGYKYGGNASASHSNTRSSLLDKRGNYLSEQSENSGVETKSAEVRKLAHEALLNKTTND